MIRALQRYRAFTPLLVLLIVGAFAGQVVEQRDDDRRSGPALFSRDSGNDGVLALAMWLERLGYQVDRLEWTHAVPTSETDLLFVLRPTRRFQANEADDLVQWVRDGGILVYHPNRFSGSSPPNTPSDGLSERLGLVVSRVGNITHASLGLPLASRPEVREIAANSALELELQDSSWTPMLLSERRILGATRPLGQGRVYAVTAPALFENQRLPQGTNSDFVLSVLTRHPDVRRIGFDEYHHGLVRAPDLMSAVRSSPWGWAIMYAGAATFLFMLWGGRRFGPPIIPERSIGRSTGDYVSALAGLIQRARAAEWAQREYARLLRREMSRVLGVRADLAVGDLERVVKGRRGGDSNELVSRLRELEGSAMNERALLDRVREAERDLRSLRGVEVS